jgi:diaminopimelate decarboxylase
MTQITFSEPATLFEIGGQPIARLAERFGTPVYVYDAAAIARRIADLARFDVIRFASKACSNLAILSWVRRQGALVDTVSAGEIRRALAAGFAPQGDPPPIVYTADVFDRESLDLVAQQGIHVNCGSLDMFEQYAERTSGGDITVRINPGFGHGHSQKTNTGGPQSKHGIWHEELPEVVHRAQALKLNITGLHMHIGSGTDMEHLSKVGAALEVAAEAIGPSLATISAGGGLPVPYKSGDPTADVAGYFDIWDAVRRRLVDRFGHSIRMEIEPGRYLVAESGSLVTEIRAVKRMGENLYYLVDAGFNNLARPILYGAYHPIAICPANGATDRPLVDVVVGGPLCESGDIFTQREGGFVAPRRLPEANVGDLVVIRHAGAYGAVMGSNYNSKPLAAEVLLLNDEAHLVRRAQSFDELIQGESIPAELRNG